MDRVGIIGLAQTKYQRYNPASHAELAYEVTCNGDDINIVLNGHVIHQLKYDDIDALKPRSRKGFIGLQDHHNTVEFRNIRIKPIH